MKYLLGIIMQKWWEKSEPCSAATCVTVFPASSCCHDDWLRSSICTADTDWLLIIWQPSDKQMLHVTTSAHQVLQHSFRRYTGDGFQLQLFYRKVKKLIYLGVEGKHNASNSSKFRCYQIERETRAGVKPRPMKINKKLSFCRDDGNAFSRLKLSTAAQLDKKRHFKGVQYDLEATQGCFRNELRLRLLILLRSRLWP